MDNLLSPRYLKSIELKPSIELLSDEYEIGRHFVVQIIYGDDYKERADLLFNTMQDACQFTVERTPFQNIQDFFDIIQNLKVRIEKQRKPVGVFVIVLCHGKAAEGGHLFCDNGDKIAFSEVWDEFIKMEVLNRKPKIFLFQTHFVPTRDAFDGVNRSKRLYDVAAPGADLFLISRNIARKSQDNFIDNFCEYIRSHGKQVDIFELATFATHTDRPLIVSTLTARFFFQKSETRGYTYSILEGVAQIKKRIQGQIGGNN